jgi:putative polyhydroxyalkanoate system protein
MAKIDLEVDHGQTPMAARASFEKAISAAQGRFGTWIHRADWSADRNSVRMTGTGFDVELSYDDQKVYVRGTVPLVARLMDGPIKSFIRQALAEES